LAQSAGPVEERTANAVKVKTLMSGVWRMDGAVRSASVCCEGVWGKPWALLAAVSVCEVRYCHAAFLPGAVEGRK
jgi:hypothetical protein